MVNRLPEKLTALRKHYGYAQGDLAQKMGVAVNEYMNWENGNTIPMMEQLKSLSGIFRVPLQNLVDNTKEVELPTIEASEDSIEIPFIQEDAQDSLSSLYEMKSTNTTDVTEYLGETKVVNTQQFEPTVVNEIVDDTEEVKADYDEDDEYDDYDEDEEDDDEPIGLKDLFSRKKDTSKKQEVKSEKKPFDLKYIIIAVIAIIVILLIVLISSIFRNDDTTSLDLTSDNRFAVGSTYTMYLKDKGVLETTGNSVPSLDATDLVQISVNGSNAIGLKDNGRIVVAGNPSYSSEVKSWENVTYIALGSSHAVAVKDDGTVVCTGSSNACDVSDWSNIEKVYAGNDITIGQTTDGKLVSSGSFSSSDRINALQNVTSVSIGAKEIAVVNTSGTVSCYAIGSEATSNTAVWTSVTQVAVGNEYVAGISSGRAILATNDESASSIANSWTDTIKYIASNGNTLVAVTANDTLVGIGDNSANLYTATSSEATASTETATPTPTATTTPTPTPTATTSTQTQLSTPSNITYTITSANVEINWNAVNGADYYEVTVSTNPETKLQSAKNSASISADKFTDATGYTISVTAYSNSSSVNPSSTASGQMVYTRVTTKLTQPQNVAGSSTAEGLTITWDAVSNADYYHLIVSGGNASGEVVTVNNATTYTYKNLNSGTYQIAISAVSNNAKFSESDPTVGSVAYEVTKVPLSSIDPNQVQFVWAGTSLNITWKAIENAASYSVTVNGQVYSSATNSLTIDVSGWGSGQYTFAFVANPAEDSTTLASSTSVSVNTTYQSVTPSTPETTSTPETQG